MEKELQGKLVEILTSIQSGVGQAKDFALSQLPDIAQSYVLYERAYLTTLTALCVAALLAVWFLAFPRMHRAWKDDFGTNGLQWFLCGIATLFLGGWPLSKFSELMLVWFAPKVWLLKELAHLVK